MSQASKTPRKSKRKTSSDVIPKAPTANLTPSLRAELEKETFENEPPSTRSNTSSQTSSFISSFSSRSNSLPPGASATCLRALEKDRIIDHEQEPFSIHNQTSGTLSYDSISTFSRTEGLAQSKVLPQPTKIALKEFRLPNEDFPQMPIPINDAAFCDVTHGYSTPLPCAIPQRFKRHGELETKYIKECIDGVIAQYNASGRNDIELKITIDRELDGIPSTRIEMIKKAKKSQTRELLNRAYVQCVKYQEEQGYITDCDTAISSTVCSRSTVTLPQPAPPRQYSLLRIFNCIFGRFKFW